MPDSTKIAFRTSLAETAPFDAEGVGTLRFEGENIYKWVKYIGPNPGEDTEAYTQPWLFEVAYYSGETGYQNSEVTIDLTAVANTRIPAGVFISSGVIGTVDGKAGYSYPNLDNFDGLLAVYQNNYCWIQLRGSVNSRGGGVGYTYGLTQTDGSVTEAAGLPDDGQLQNVKGGTDRVVINHYGGSVPRGICNFVF